MTHLYAKPRQVYLVLAVLAGIGIWAGLQLPVALFPNASRPYIGIAIPYGHSTAAIFRNRFGAELEQRLRSISLSNAKTTKVEATYSAETARIRVTFSWGDSSEVAQREACALVDTVKTQLEAEVMRSTSCENWNDNGGFLAVSFYSAERDAKALYNLLKPALTGGLASVKDAQDASINQPSEDALVVTIDPYRLAAAGLFPADVQATLQQGLSGTPAGSLTTDGVRLELEMPQKLQDIEGIKQLPILTPSGAKIPLTAVATVDLQPRSRGSNLFRTNNQPSTMVFASPKPGSNVKSMAEDLLAVIGRAKASLPSDVDFKVLVDPSGFIGAATTNVVREVIMGSLLAVLVLFLFVGTLRNVATAAIEIPLSIVLALILMRLTGVSLNLISLGGLALSAGMNVDGSVVVMETIFRRFHERKAKAGDPNTSVESPLETVVAAVREIAPALLMSTLASVIVFLPLIFTSDLSYALLGDLAKAVVYSHSASAIVALILVPTVRLHLLGRGEAPEKPAPLEGLLAFLERGVDRLQRRLAASLGLKTLVFLTAFGALPLLASVVVPKLPRELIGTPDTDWVVLNITAPLNTSMVQMDMQGGEVERRVLREHADLVSYTFNQIYQPTRASLLIRLKDKHDMAKAKKLLSADFKDSATAKFFVSEWNPSEMPVPQFNDLQLNVRGTDIASAGRGAASLVEALKDAKIYERIRAKPEVDARTGLWLHPYELTWPFLRAQDHRITPAAAMDLVQLTTEDRYVGDIMHGDEPIPINLRVQADHGPVGSEISALPLAAAGKIVPFQALFTQERRKIPPPARYEDGGLALKIAGTLAPGDTGTAAALARAEALVNQWRADGSTHSGDVTVEFVDGQEELTKTLRQLLHAGGWSLMLIALMLYLQFGGFAETITVMTALLFGIIGAALSLYICHSKLSVNAGLGVILLNGLAVANSIMLVDCAKRYLATGMEPLEAVCAAARARLRPILITSVTTALGMLPIALGVGEGGSILQPLGIAVAGGLSVSALLTVVVVPALHLVWLQAAARRRVRQPAPEVVPA